MAVLPTLILASTLVAPDCHESSLVFHQVGQSNHTLKVVPTDLSVYLGQSVTCVRDGSAWQCHAYVEIGARVVSTDLQCDFCDPEHPQSQCLLTVSLRRIDYSEELLLRLIKFVIMSAFFVMAIGGCVMIFIAFKAVLLERT